VRFARNREGGMFATVVADSLSASHWLAERIMLDISGQQLATTLKALAMDEADALYVLERFYPHLGTETNGVARGLFLWNSLDPDDCYRRVEAWRRADSHTMRNGTEPAENANEDAAAQPILRSRRVLRSHG